jgi:hypothetical protein
MLVDQFDGWCRKVRAPVFFLQRVLAATRRNVMAQGNALGSCRHVIKP